MGEGERAREEQNMGLTTIMPAGQTHAASAADLLSILASSPEAFLHPTEHVHAAAVYTAKQLLDPLASDIADAQVARRTENRRKRKRGEDAAREGVLPIREVYTSGFAANQIWEQAKRVIDAAIHEAEEVLRNINTQPEGTSRSAQNGHTDDFTGDVDVDEDWPKGLDGEDEEALGSDEADMMESVMQEIEHDDGSEDEDIEDIEDEEDVDLNDQTDERPSTYVPDPNGLNDGFFSIDDFNKQSQFLEQMDARGEEDNPSDEDEIDWDTDPLATPLTRTKLTALREDEDEDDNEDDGPTFGNADLNAPDSDDNMEDGGVELDGVMPGLDNTNDIQYADFFEPPAKKPSKTKRMRALPKTQPSKSPRRNEDVEGDIKRAMDDVRRDLLDSESEISEDEQDDDAEATAKDGTVGKEKAKNLSTHEKQRAAIAAEIRKLEAASVAKRDWTLSGEARAANRPVNSLIEEDLEFERAGKPVPVITAEVSEEIEALIKRRIIARDFDELVRRHPEAIGSAGETRRGRVEVDDEKSKIGLGEVYEQEHLKGTDPTFIDSRSKATKKAHDEIDRLWKDVSAQLDLLSNLHFKPKRAEVEIKSVEDKPTIGMGDARPVGEEGENMLAPQEIYRPGDENARGDEVLSKSGVRVSKEEMSREEKLRRRRREKERVKKAAGNEAARTQSRTAKPREKSKKEEKSDILTQLRKGQVKVIGKKGQMEELGKKKKTDGAGESGSALKL